MDPGSMTGPHDRFFRYLFNHRARMEALLRHNLPAPLVAAIDWSTLRRESGTLTDWDRETRNDLLFSARLLHSLEEEPPHFFLIEHQSRVEQMMAPRLHDYAWRRIQHWLEQHPRSRLIPQVTSLVVYPRWGREWTAPLRLEDHYGVRARALGKWHRRWALSSGYQLDKLARQSELALSGFQGPPLVPLGLLVLRWAGTEDLVLRLPHWRELFVRVFADDYGSQRLYRVARYVHVLGDERAHGVLTDMLHSIMEPGRAEAFMRTMAEVLEERGHKRGLTEGRAEGLAMAVLRALAARGVHVGELSRQRIESCKDVATLERWLDRAVGATHLSEVLDGPAQ